jgi:hypothetical protein
MENKKIITHKIQHNTGTKLGKEVNTHQLYDIRKGIEVKIHSIIFKDNIKYTQIYLQCVVSSTVQPQEIMIGK